jgi:hypothetical protein
MRFLGLKVVSLASVLKKKYEKKGYPPAFIVFNRDNNVQFGINPDSRVGSFKFFFLCECFLNLSI